MKPAEEVIKPYLKQYPELRFAVTDCTLGFWSNDQERFVPFASLALTGEWFFLPWEILVNGERIKRNWKPV